MYFLKTLLVFVVILSLSPSDVFGRVYVWKDKNGKTHMSSQKPQKEIEDLNQYKSRKPFQDSKLPASKYDDFLNAVVVIKTSHGLGTGFFISNSGLIVTNHHVVGSEKTVSIKTRDLKTVMGKVVALDKKRDLAIISSRGKVLSHLKLAGANEGGVGTDVVAVGTPLGLEWSISKGVVSAIRKDEKFMDGIRVIQTDTAINPGNSGGPLIAIETGAVVGVNTFKVSGRGIEGLNFAVSVEELKKVFPYYFQKSQ